MATTKITVYRNGKPLKGAQVSLEYSGLTQMGFTRKFSTNSDGVAFVEHSSTGRATLWVNSQNKGSISTPGQDVVYL